MSQICLQSDLLLNLLTEIGKHRALADHETDLIEAIVCRGHRSSGNYHRWTPDMDRKLLKAANQRGGIKAFSERHGLAMWSAYSRLRKLREAKLRKKAQSGKGE